MRRMGDFHEIFVVAFFLAVPLKAISVNPSLCPTNKIAPHKRIANWEYGTGRTFGAFYDLLTPGNTPYDAPNYQNDLQEQPQEDDPSDCGEIEDYDENDLSSITPQGNRRRDHRDSRGFDIRTFFGNDPERPPNRPERPPNRPERPPNRPERPPHHRPTRPPSYPQRPPNYPQRPPNYPQRPPSYPERPPNYPERPPSYPQRPPSTNRPQGSYPATKPPYWCGGIFCLNEYRPPQPQIPSDMVKPVQEYSEEGQVTYRPNLVGGPLGHVVGASPAVPTRQDETTTPRTFYDRFRASTQSNSPYTTRHPRARNLNSNLFGSFVDLLFK